MSSTVGVLVNLVFIHIPVLMPYPHIGGGLVRTIGILIGNPVAFLQVINVVHGKIARGFRLSISGRLSFGRYKLPVSCLSHSCKKLNYYRVLRNCSDGVVKKMPFCAIFRGLVSATQPFFSGSRYASAPGFFPIFLP